MGSNLQHIKSLIGKYVNGKATVEEVVTISDWLKESETNKDIFLTTKQDLTKRQKTTNDWQKFEARYGEQLQPTKRSKRLLGFISLAASISLVVGVSLHLMNTERNPYAEMLAEAGAAEIPEHTTLSLFNGEQIALKKTHSVIQVEKEGQQISVEDSEAHETVTVASSDEPVINQMLVPYGNTAQVKLADGTRVWLNAGSRLIFPNHFNNQKRREVVLVGEAFFEVAHNANQPFKVVTEEMVYTVLGTSFNIQSFPNSASVTAVLVEGSLQVETKTLLNKQKVILKPGEKSQFSRIKDKMSIANVNTSFYTSWKDGYLMLDKNRLGKLVKQIERYYHSDLVLSNDLMNIPSQLSGKLLLDDDPEQVYQTLCDLNGLTYEIKNNQVIFKKQ